MLTLTSDLVMTLNHLIIRCSNAGTLGNVEYAFFAMAPGLPIGVRYMGQIELFDIRTESKKNNLC